MITRITTTEFETDDGVIHDIPFLERYLIYDSPRLQSSTRWASKNNLQ